MAQIIFQLQGGYPARLKKVLIVTPPIWFRAPYKILSPFVKEKIRDRVCMFLISFIFYIWLHYCLLYVLNVVKLCVFTEIKNHSIIL